MPTSSSLVCAVDSNQLRTQNEQLWKIIERQRTNIKALQKEKSFLIAERDGLQDKLKTLERTHSKQRTSPEVIVKTDDEHQQSPMPPTRSPYRSNNNNKIDNDQQQKEKPFFYSSLNASDTTPLNTGDRQQTPLNIALLEKNRSQSKQPSDSDCHSSPLLLSTITTTEGSSSSSVVPVSSSSSPTVNSTPMNVTSLPTSATSSLLPVITTGGTIGSVTHRGGHRSQRKSHLFTSTTPALPGIGLDPPCLDTNGDHNVNELDNHRSLITTTTSSPLPPLPQQHVYSISSLSSSSVSSFSTSTSSSLLSPGTSSTSLTPSNVSNSISNITIKVLGSNIRQNDKCREVISFIISIGRKPDEDCTEFEELWRVEKLYSHFLELDTKIKAGHRSIGHRIAKLPDKALFNTNSPSKVDRRKAALEHYLQHIILLPLDDNSDLCEFLSTNVVDSSVMYSRTGRKEGYLTKRGKNFGGWKTRYFVLHGSSLEYYDTKEGSHLGTIRLVNAQIGRQTPGPSSSVDDGSAIYRHAFLIVEQKRSGSSYLSRHILCADSDEDRDSWVDALFKVVSMEDEKQQQRSVPLSTETSHSNTSRGKKKEVSGKSSLITTLESELDADKWKSSIGEQHTISMGPPPPPSKTINDSSLLSAAPPPIILNQHTNLDQYRPANGHHKHQRPTHHLTRRSSMVNLLNPNGEDEIILPPRAISPSPAFNRQSDDLLGNDLPEKKTKHKRMTFWGKKMFNSSSNDDLVIPSRTSPSSSSTTTHQHTSNTIEPSSSSSSAYGFRGFLSRPSHETGHASVSNGNTSMSQRPVFGIPLDESVQVSRVSESCQLPSIVFRCIEYLDAKKAVLEEGLYRLSGSNMMIKSLKQRFNLEGDINLLAEKEEYDVHAVAGLLKMWLRELPTNVLTREHRMDFLHVIDLFDHKDRVNELGRLVSLLPITNYTLLRALTAHLIQVIQHSDVNKMTMRNVSIVFSPTLGIPGTIFHLLLSEFDYIFWTTGDNVAPTTLTDENESNKALVEDDLTPEKKCTMETRPTLQHYGGRSNRNSVNYRESAPDSIVDLEKHQGQQPLVLDDIEDEMGDLMITDESDTVTLEEDLQPTANAT